MRITITLPPALAVFVGYAVRAGHYPSELEVLHQALRLLSERGVRALVQEGIDSADRGELRDAEIVFAEIREKLAAAAAEQKANPPQPLSTAAIYNWLADGIDALDMGRAEYAHETLVGLRDRLKEIVASAKREDQSCEALPRVRFDRKDDVRLSDTEPSRPEDGSPESDFEIDWTKEPATERERRIRAAMLRKVIAGRPAFARLEMGSLLSESATRCYRVEEAASDFRAAYATAQAASDDFADKAKKKRMEEAIREVDGEGLARS